MGYIRYFDRRVFEKLPPKVPFSWPDGSLGEDPYAVQRSAAKVGAEIQSFLADMRMLVRRELLPDGPGPGLFRDVDLEIVHGTADWIVRAARWRLALVKRERFDLGSNKVDGLFDLLGEVLAFPLTAGGNRLEVKHSEEFAPPEDALYCEILPEPGGGFGGGRFEDMYVVSDGRVTLVGFTEYEWKIGKMVPADDDELPDDFPPMPAHRLTAETTSMPVPRFDTPITVQFDDVDLYGIAHHARYLIYLERSRLDLFQRLGLLPGPDADDQWLVYQVNLRYHQPSRLLEKLRVETWCSRVTGVRVVFDSRIMGNDELKATGQVQLAYTDRQGRPQRLEERYRNEFLDAENPHRDGLEELA